MASKHSQRLISPGAVPLLDIEGSAYDCGQMLADAWRAPLLLASRAGDDAPWMSQDPARKLIEKRLPHLVELFRGMAGALKLPVEKLVIPRPTETTCGCTSFAIAPAATLDGQLLAGQTKDAAVDRLHKYLVLRLSLNEGPSILTLTYPGMLFGHGFVTGGCAMFRNSLPAGARPEGRLAYDLWGLLALHCRTAEEAAELARRYPVIEPFHCTISDENGSIVGLESAAGGVEALQPKRDVYVHANNVESCHRLRRHQQVGQAFLECSEHRQDRLRERLQHDRGRLTPQLVYASLCDHEGHPASVCNHQNRDFLTTASIVAEPATRRIWVTRGPPCQNWPTEYKL